MATGTATATTSNTPSSGETIEEKKARGDSDHVAPRRRSRPSHRRLHSKPDRAELPDNDTSSYRYTESEP